MWFPSETSPTPQPSPTDSVVDVVTDGAQAVAGATVDVLAVAWHVGVGAGAGIAAALALIVALSALGRRRDLYHHLAHYCRMGLYLTGASVGARLGVLWAIAGQLRPDWAGIVLHIILIASIASITWVIAGLSRAIEATIDSSIAASGDEARSRRIATQTQILRRVAEAVVVVCGLVGIVMTFPAARIAMGSLLASAGLVSIIAGLAAQSTLGNVFAGIQLATTVAIRVGDVVVIEGEYGQIEEITLTYVVVHIWDDRRLILPSTYFTTQPFANWSRRGAEVTGAVVVDLDWNVPIAELRRFVQSVLDETPTWDGRSVSTDVYDISGPTVKVRVAMSAANPSDAWALQCLMREKLVTWLQEEKPGAMPRTRVALDPAPSAAHADPASA